MLIAKSTIRVVLGCDVSVNLWQPADHGLTNLKPAKFKFC